MPSKLNRLIAALGCSAFYRLMCTLLVATLVAGLVLLATNANVSFMGYGRGMGCVPAMDLGLTQGDSASNGIFVNLKPGSWQFASEVDVCAQRPFGLLIVGLGLLTLARVLRLGAQMQDDPAGTV